MSNIYQTTRTKWSEIWHAASVSEELMIAQSRRSLKTIKHYLPYLPKDQLILEAGSGLSAIAILLRQQGYQVVGLDYTMNALHMSRDYDPSLPLIGGDVHQLPFADASLGAYLSFGVLEHFEHGMQPALLEAHRVLKPAGVLILTIPYPNWVYQLVQWKRQQFHHDPLTDKQFYESTYTNADLRQHIMATNFEILDLIPTSHDFTLWGVGRPFRKDGYYQTSWLAEVLGEGLNMILPWAFNFMTLVLARKV